MRWSLLVLLPLLSLRAAGQQSATAPENANLEESSKVELEVLRQQVQLLEADVARLSSLSRAESLPDATSPPDEHTWFGRRLESAGNGPRTTVFTMGTTVSPFLVSFICLVVIALTLGTNFTVEALHPLVPERYEPIVHKVEEECMHRRVRTEPTPKSAPSR